MEAFIMMIMIYNGRNKATTSLKRARRQNRELGNIYIIEMVTELWRCAFNSEFTVRMLTHVLCKPTYIFFHSFISTMSYSLQTSFNSLMKDWADEYHVWGTPTRSPSRSNLR